MKLVLFLIFLTCCIYQMHAGSIQPGPPLIEYCHYMKDLFDNGNYLKTACVVHNSSPYKDAEEQCKNINMNLFVLNDEIVTSHLLDAAQEKYPGEKGWLWINGRRRSYSKEWITYNADGSILGPLNENISFYSNHEEGDCLRIAAKYTGIYGVLPGKCEERPWFICEHNVQTQEPPKLDTKQCFFNQHLHNRKSRKYIKSVCFNSESCIYDHARRKCAQLGMNLFTFDSEETDESFFEVSGGILKQFAGGHFWVNGIRNPQNNEWITYYANRTVKGPIYKDFEWVNLGTYHGVSNGDYLLLSGTVGPYQGLGFGSDRRSGIICEYYSDEF